ncbi:MAG: hypothetical protein K0S06_563 [Microvirga sp.]|jgi:hypothetical protein|nr:hypothetical protein [Microvirga sp.]
MIRWEKQEGGWWRGLSGELAIASVLRASAGGTPKWRWEVSAVEPPKGPAAPATVRPRSRRAGQRTITGRAGWRSRR